MAKESDSQNMKERKISIFNGSLPLNQLTQISNNISPNGCYQVQHSVCRQEPFHIFICIMWALCNNVRVFLLLIHWRPPPLTLRTAKATQNHRQEEKHRMRKIWIWMKNMFGLCGEGNVIETVLRVVVIVVAFHFVYPSINCSRWLNLVYNKSHQDPFILLITATNKFNKMCAVPCKMHQLNGICHLFQRNWSPLFSHGLFTWF